MNTEHLERCSSAEWAEAVQKCIIPWVSDGVDLGNDVLEVDPDLAGSLTARLGGTNDHAVRFRAAKPYPGTA